MIPRSLPAAVRLSSSVVNSSGLYCASTRSSVWREEAIACSNPDFLDILDGDRRRPSGRRAWSCAGSHARRSPWARSSVPPLSRYAVMPVARKVWQLASPSPTVCDAPLDHPKHIHSAHSARAEPARPRHRAPQGRVFLGRDPGPVEIGVERGLRLVMDRHGVVLAAFFLEPQPPALALLVAVLDAHADDSGDARKAVDHHGQQGAIA